MDQSNSESGSGDTMQERESERRLNQWILLEANRWTIVGLLLLAVFILLVLLATANPAPASELLQLEAPVDTAFQGLIAGIITGVTLVLTINQLVLSQELGPLGQQRDRMQGAMNFRQDVEAETELAVSPTEASAFLRALVEATERKAVALQDTVGDRTDEEAVDEVTSYVDDLTENAQEVSEELADAQFGTYQVLGAALDYDYSRKIHTARQIQNDHGDALSDEANGTLDDLQEVLEFLGPAREHFKTYYFQWELINLSYAILFTTIPALIVAFTMILFFDPELVSGTIWGVESVLLIVCLAVTFGVMPFMVLFAYILRVATVAKRTLAVGPFTLRETEEAEEIQWEE
ncbi:MULTISPECIES: hypothetical protein [Natrialbaceae]|uniref:hypothetical protein n=1 Tax=Natrialbaceae TaxID=1644061 RepID=UPI00207C4EB3|nr:hypothetical protein [Natronococcus sp. CG52]